MRLISWNVNGLRAVLKKGFGQSVRALQPDVLCLQETKLQPGQLADEVLGQELPGYRSWWSCAERKGYSGTAVFSRVEPAAVMYGIGVPEFDAEGRALTLEFPEFYLVNIYAPNSQPGLVRIGYRLSWEEALLRWLQRLEQTKPVVLCGDFNVAHTEQDLKNPAANRGTAGFSDQERAAFSRLLAAGYADTFRSLHPEAVGAYTWWSYLYHARDTNAGWRIDYFLVSQPLLPRVKEASVHMEVLGSDHCPAGLLIEP